MVIPSQTLKEILHMNEAFKAQMSDTLHDLVDVLKDTLHDLTDGLKDTLHDLTNGIKDSFHSIQDSLAIIEERYLMTDIRDEYNQEAYAWYDFEADCDDWYMDSCIFGMTTTFIFYLMNPIHLF
jgi:hypothetical protein